VQYDAVGISGEVGLRKPDPPFPASGAPCSRGGCGRPELGETVALLAVALSARSLGLIVPILKDAGQLERDLGQLTIAGASVADFGAALLLSLFFSEPAGRPTTKLVLLVGLVLLVVVVALAMSRLSMSMRLDVALTRLQDATADIRVRIAIVLLIAFVAVAERIGLEAILGAFLAGGILAAADKQTMSNPHFRAKLEAIGYGFLGAGVLRHQWDPVRPEGVHPQPVVAASGPAFPARAAAGARPAGPAVPPAARAARRLGRGAATSHLAAVPGHRRADRAQYRQAQRRDRRGAGLRGPAVGGDLPSDRACHPRSATISASIADARRRSHATNHVT